jgi:hypothetical protein
MSSELLNSRPDIPQRPLIKMPKTAGTEKHSPTVETIQIIRLFSTRISPREVSAILNLNFHALLFVKVRLLMNSYRKRLHLEKNSFSLHILLPNTEYYVFFSVKVYGNLCYSLTCYAYKIFTDILDNFK